MGLHLAGEGAEAQKEGRVPRVTREGPEAGSEAQGRGSAHRTTFLSRAGGWEEAAPLGRDLSLVPQSSLCRSTDPRPARTPRPAVKVAEDSHALGNEPGACQLSGFSPSQRRSP